MAKNNSIQHLIELNIQTKYEQLLEVKILHDYFQEENFRGTRIVPDNLTKVRLKQNKLKAACEEASILVGFGETAGSSPLEDIKSPLKMTFWLFVEDANYLNYTDIPYEFGNHIYHFTNRDEDKIEDEYGNLSNDQYVQEVDRLPVAGAVFDYRFEEPMEDVEVEVTNELGETVYEKQMSGEVTVCTINVADEPAGKYNLLLDGIEEFSFYVAPEGTDGAFGVIDLYIDPNDSGPYSLFTESGELVKKKPYNIHFKSRAVKWKYLCLETNPAKPQHIEHSAYSNTKGDVEIEFSEATEVEYSGSPAIMIETTEPIPFKERQEEKIKLRTLRGKSKIEWITDLPVASAKSPLKVEKDANSDVYSELIVYL